MSDVLMSVGSYILNQPLFYFIIAVLFVACFKGCLVKIPYATILSTIVSSCGLIIGLAALYDSTTIVDRMTQELFKRKFIFLNDLKLGYVAVAIFIIVVISSNLVIGFIAINQSLSNSESARSRRCSPTSCIKSSTTVCLLRTFLVLNYLIYYLLLMTTIFTFALLIACYVLSSLCYASTPTTRDILPPDDRLRIDLQLLGPVINFPSNETNLLDFRGVRLQKLCEDYTTELMFHSILCFIGFTLSCVGFVNYLINLSVNAAKLNTKQKFEELIYLSPEMAIFDPKD